MNYKENLNGLKCACDQPDCDNSQIYFHPLCHTEANCEASYSKPDEAIILYCEICNKEVIRIKVASKFEGTINTTN